MKGSLDVLRIEGHEGEKDGANVVLAAFFPDGVQFFNDGGGGEVGAQIVGAGQDEEVTGMIRQNVVLKAQPGCVRRVAAAAKVDSGKV